jgi:dCTP deaminase
MTIMSDRWITRMAREHRMIEPFEGRQVRAGVISYGVSSYGYDMRVAREFRIFTNVLNSIVDPKAFDPKSFVEYEGDVCIVPPNSFALARSVEYFRIPRNILTVTVGKSTYARCGIITNVTPFEPEWEGYVTLEISNTTPLPARRGATSPACCGRSTTPRARSPATGTTPKKKLPRRRTGPRSRCSATLTRSSTATPSSAAASSPPPSSPS